MEAVTYIRVQTNGLPNHCYNAAVDEMEELEVDFTVKWNWQVGENTRNADSTAVYSSLVCTKA